MESNRDVLVEVKSVSKKLCRDLKLSIWYGLTDFIRVFVGLPRSTNRLRKSEFWAVKEVCFTLRRGECIGLIGHNGAGKSTILKMLNGLLRPDEGEILIKGKIGALIDLGAGFNPQLTGRENIYVNGQLLGLSKKEVDEKIESIIDFSEVREFIDSPVQNFSSGMKVRLGFSVAVQMEPDVLLIDEVLAVGDIGFVLKCINKMDELKSRTAMIFVSHSMPQVSRMCTSVLLMNKGRCDFQTTDVPLGISRYYQLFKPVKRINIGNEYAELREIVLSANERLPAPGEDLVVNHGESLRISFRLDFKKRIEKPAITLIFYDKEQKSFAEVLNFPEQINIDTLFGTVVFSANLPITNFSGGRFSISIDITEIAGGVRRNVARFQSAAYFDAYSRLYTWSPVQFDAEWKMEQDTP